MPTTIFEKQIILSLVAAIPNARAKQRLTQEGLAKKSGMSIQKIKAVEETSELPSFSTLDKLYKALGLDIEIKIKKKKA